MYVGLASWLIHLFFGFELIKACEKISQSCGFGVASQFHRHA